MAEKSPARHRKTQSRIELAWVLASRTISATLQAFTMGLLAYHLGPEGFSFAASINAAMYSIAVVNGFGLNRQIQFRRATGAPFSVLSILYLSRLRYSWVSSILWLCVTASIGLITGNTNWYYVAALSLWLLSEQITTIWNAVSIVDNNSRALLQSYLYRRMPPLLVLASIHFTDLPALLAWILGLVLGSSLAYCMGVRAQELWCRKILPSRRLDPDHEVARVDMPFWLAQMGEELPTLDVAVLSLLDPLTAGLYGLASRVVAPMRLVAKSLASVLFPKLVRLGRVTPGRFVRILVMGGAINTSMFIGIVAISSLVPRLIGSSYDDSVQPIRILALALALNGIGSLSSVILQSTTKPHANQLAGIVTLGAAILQVLGVAWVGYSSGPDNAAWAVVAIQAASAVILTATAAMLALTIQRREELPMDTPCRKEWQSAINRKQR